MSSIRNQIAVAMLAAWNSEERPAGVPELVRAPFRQVEVGDDMPKWAGLYFLQDDPTLAEKERPGDETVPDRIHELLMGVELRCCGAPTDIPEELLDDCEIWAVKVWNDNTLGGLAQYLRTHGTTMERANEHRPLGKMLIAVRAVYTTAANDFETQ